MKASSIEPMLCVPTSEPPSGPEWSYELKLDGYRGLAIKAAGRCKLLSRNGKDLSVRFPETTMSLQRLPDDTVIDGRSSRWTPSDGHHSAFYRTRVNAITRWYSMPSTSCSCLART